MRDATTYGPNGAESCPAKVDATGSPVFWLAPVPYQPDAPTAGDPIVVYANEGRWIAECPDCRGAQLASHHDPRFMCVECANVANGGAWRPLTWPQDRPAIEQVLDGRQPVNQNWAPGETVADLAAANTAHRVSP